MVGVSNFRHAQYDAQGVGIDDPQTSLSSVRQDPTTGALVGVSLPAPQPTFMFVGDSWASRSYAAIGNNIAYQDNGAITWAQSLSTHRLEILRPTVAAGGTSASQWAAGLIQSALDGVRPGFVAVLLGTNDIGADDTAANIIANLATVYQTILANGARLIALSIPPYGPTYVVSGETLAQKNAKRQIVNAAIASFCEARPSCHFVDQFASQVNPTDANGYARTAYSETIGTTGLHATAAGCRQVGQLIANIINATVTDSRIHVSSTIDSFDYDAAASNRASNPLFTGSGGTTSVGAGTAISGTVATSWTVATVAGTATVVCSTPARTVANDGDDYGNNQRMVITGAGAADVVTLRTGSISARFAQGDLVEGEAYVRVTGAAQLKGIRLLMQSVQGGVTFINTGMGYQSTGFIYDQADARLVIKTPPMLIGAGALTSHILALDVAFGAAGGAATVDVGRMVWRKLN